MSFSFNYRGDFAGDVDLEYEPGRFRTIGGFHLEFIGDRPVTHVTIPGPPARAQRTLNGEES